MSAETMSASPLAPTHENTSLEELQREVIGAFQGRIKPVRVPPTYRLGILLVAIVMMILPLVYLAIIAGVCYAVYFHAVNDIGMLAAGSGRGKLVVLIVYLAPMVAGAILILFMFKPLFSRRPPSPKSQTLDPASQPLVFAFVNRVCEAVGARKPRQIEIDCQVNASASFRRGLLSLVGNDLVLTIGLPLVAGLSTRQLAGVLAHEFGHFAQSAGMRLTYIIRSISHWFTRVVYERDEWDQRLVNWSKGIDIRFGWVFYVTRFFVWLTRRILWVLMVIGHGVSGFMLRQMEFDADRNEARLAGSDEFESTSRRIVALSIANRGAESDLTDFYREGRLGDDFPKLVLHNVNQFTTDVYQKIGKMVDESKTGWFDTHPCDKERIASARREDAPGIFHLELPATKLFRDFDATSQDMTWVYYRNVLGDELKRESVQPVAELLARQEQEHGAFKALHRYFQATYRADRALPLPNDGIDANAELDRMRSGLEAARAQAIAGFTKYKQDCKRFDEADEEQEKLIVAELEAFEIIAAKRLHGSIQLLHDASASERIADAAAHQAECAVLLPSLARLNANVPAVVKLMRANGYLGATLQNLSQKGEDQQLIRAIQAQMPISYELLNEARQPLHAKPYPFDHARKETSMADFVLESLPDSSNPVQIYYASNKLIENFHRLRGRIIGRLCCIAESVESSIGLEPLPEPLDETKTTDNQAPANASPAKSAS